MKRGNLYEKGNFSIFIDIPSAKQNIIAEATDDVMRAILIHFFIISSHWSTDFLCGISEMSLVAVMLIPEIEIHTAKLCTLIIRWKIPIASAPEPDEIKIP